LLASFSSHLQRWDRYWFYEGYRPNNILEELETYDVNYHIQIFAGPLSIFVEGYRAALIKLGVLKIDA
jgi:hypothetical protein